MASVFLQFLPEEAAYDGTAWPTFQRFQGTNFPVTGLAYNDTTLQSSYWKSRAVNYASGNLVADIDWYADTATSGAVVWDAQIAVINAGTDTQDVTTKAFAATQTITTTHPGTTARRLLRSTITISNLDTIAIDKDFWLKVYRDAANASDTLVGNSILTLVTLSYLSV